MSQPSRHIPTKVRKTLIEEAGGKCANPGCPNQLIHIHHIERWHIHKAHNSESMVAICPACHDQVDRGELRITDAETLAWKELRREEQQSGHVYIEPGDPVELLLGTLSVRGRDGLFVLDIDEGNQLSFVVEDGDLLFLHGILTSYSGEPLVRIIGNHVKPIGPDVLLKRRTGRLLLNVRDRSTIVPGWARYGLSLTEPKRSLRRMPLLELTVVGPGRVRVKGIWMSTATGVMIFDDAMAVFDQSREQPFLVLADPGAVVHGDASGPLFGFGDAAYSFRPRSG